jgi:hypothetical protein
MARRAIPAGVERRVRAAARNRCGYCLAPQRLVMARLHLDHIIPIALGGGDEGANLWLACPICNGHKSDKAAAADPETGRDTPLFDPRTQVWAEHFRWEDRGLRISGLTAIGRATVAAWLLDEDPDALEVRSYWIEAGWHPPRD